MLSLLCIWMIIPLIMIWISVLFLISSPFLLRVPFKHDFLNPLVINKSNLSYGNNNQKRVSESTFWVLVRGCSGETCFAIVWWVTRIWITDKWCGWRLSLKTKKNIMAFFKHVSQTWIMNLESLIIHSDEHSFNTVLLLVADYATTCASE